MLWKSIMDIDISYLPANSAELKEIIISLAASRADLEETEHNYRKRIDYLQELIPLLQNEMLGSNDSLFSSHPNGA